MNSKREQYLRELKSFCSERGIPSRDASDLLVLVKKLEPTISQAYEEDCHKEDIDSYCEEKGLKLSDEDKDNVLERLLRKYDSEFSIWENIGSAIDFVRGGIV